MGELTLWQYFIEWLGECGYRVFLWSKGWTDEQFIDIIFQAELDRMPEQLGGRGAKR